MVAIGFNYKRGRKEKTGDYRNTKLYGQTFPLRRRVTLKERFIEESGLGNSEMRKAILTAIDTDYGIKIEIHEVQVEPKKIDEVLDSTNKVESEE